MEYLKVRRILKKDEEITLEAIKSDYRTFENIDESLKNDKAFIFKAF